MAAPQIEAMLVKEVRLDHALARARGERVKGLVDHLTDELVATGVLEFSRRDDARVVMFSTLADDLYGLVAIDIPPLRGENTR